MAAAFLVPRGAMAGAFSAPAAARLVATIDDVVVGCGEVGGPELVGGGAVAVRVAVSPERRGQGLGQALIAAMAAPLASRDEVALFTTVADDDERSRRFAERLGFSVFEHSEGFVLDLALAPPRPPRPSDLAVASLPDRPADSEWAAAHRIFSACCADTPDLHGRPPGADEWRQLLSAFPPASVFGTIDGLPAACSFAVPEDGGRWRIVITGVAPSRRGCGLGVAIKVAMERRAREFGVRYLRTNNLSTNTAIRALNQSLGYQPVTGVWRLRRDPPGAGGADLAGPPGDGPAIRPEDDSVGRPQGYRSS
jgi:GNAT superfamily N-acetyltransferase